MKRCSYNDRVLNLANDFVFSPLGHEFTENEQKALKPFFTNLDRRAFFMHGLPNTVGTTLLAMYSRLKNKRGMRGVFVDSFLPQFLAAQLVEVETAAFGGDEIKFLKAHGITTLDQFVNQSNSAAAVFEDFLKAMGTDPAYLANFAEGKKTKKFLSTWLDQYGHNSIARMGSFWLCCEDISILAAKSLEWNRPGCGYIELSTRYVDMSGKGCYPVERELEAGWGVNPKTILQTDKLSFRLYNELAGQNFDGPFPDFLRKSYGHLYTDAPRDLESGVIGETCDVLGNLLPVSALTSVGINVSGEAFPALLKHLILDDTPENLALVGLILKEARKTGAHQFARHYQPTPWDWYNWQYPEVKHFWQFSEEFSVPSDPKLKMYWENFIPKSNSDDEPYPPSVLNLQYRFDPSYISPDRRFSELSGISRGEHDKLPRDFELITIPFQGIMSFRGWRDLHRQSFCTHHRTLISPDYFDFYRYDKPAPEILDRAFSSLENANIRVDLILKDSGVPGILRQYPAVLGNQVGFVVSANLRELEFCIWQRTKYSVNHEVRQRFLDIEHKLREMFPWWCQISRADLTPAYVFARGNKAVPFEINQ